MRWWRYALAAGVILAVGVPARAVGMTDISVTLAGAPSVTIGKPLTYTVTIANTGPMGATWVRATDTLPANATFTGVRTSQGSCSRSGTTLDCLIGSVPSGRSATISISVLPTKHGAIRNHVAITCGEFEIDTADNERAISTMVKPLPEGEREGQVFRQLNARRTAQGETYLPSHGRLQKCAKAWARSMAARQRLEHNPNLAACGGSGWYTLSENVGYASFGGDVTGLWMSSCDHRRNIWDRHNTHSGVAVVYDGRGSEWWAVVYADYSRTNYESPTALEDDCFEHGAVSDGVAWMNVRTLGRWFTHHDRGGEAVRSAGGAFSGRYAMGTRDPNPGISDVTQVVRGAAGRRYTLTAYSRYLTGRPQQLYLDFLDSSFRRISVRTVSAPTSSKDWIRVTSGAITAPRGTAYVRVILYGSSLSGYASSFAWDDVVLTRS